MDGGDLRTEDFAELLERIFIIGLLAIELVEGEYHGLFNRGAGAEDVLCAYLDAILRVDHDDAGVGDSEGSYGIAHKVVGSRAVDHIELLAEKFGVEYGGKHGVAVFLFYREVVADGVSGFDSAAAFYHSTLVEHSFGECGFTGTLATEQGYVFDFVSLINLHVE